MPRKLVANPFRPGKPITTADLFSGRRQELSALVDTLFQTGNGNAQHTIITGARGVGKSSLANQIELLSNQNKTLLDELDIDPGDFRFKFIVVNHRATENQSTLDIVVSLLQEIKQKTNNEALESIKNFLGKWDLSLSVGPISVGAARTENTKNTAPNLSAEFVRTLHDVWSKIQSNFNGVVFVIDEIDTVAESSDIASFCKITTEALANANLENIVFCLVGISGAMEKLKQQHPSVGRIFRTIELRPMNDIEAKAIIDNALQNTGIQMDHNVVNEILKLSVGYPSPIHLLGYHCFDSNQDDHIDWLDFQQGLEKVISDKREELEASFLKAGSGDYRNILLSMANYDNDEVPLSVISNKVGKNSSDMSSYMAALTRRGAIDRIDRAIYKISDPLLKVYIRRFKIFDNL